MANEATQPIMYRFPPVPPSPEKRHGNMAHYHNHLMSIFSPRDLYPYLGQMKTLFRNMLHKRPWPSQNKSSPI